MSLNATFSSKSHKRTAGSSTPCCGATVLLMRAVMRSSGSRNVLCDDREIACCRNSHMQQDLELASSCQQLVSLLVYKWTFVARHFVAVDL